MTVHEVVERERARVRRLHLGAGLALGAAATATVLALGVVALGDARWLALPRPMPLIVWLLVAAADVAIVWWTARRLRARATRGRVAEAIEREQRLRAGQLRGVLEVAESGALGRRAAESLGARLADAGPALAPRLRRDARHGLLRAGVAAAITVALLGVLAPTFGDGLLALLRPVHAWRGTLLPALGFDALPAVAVRNEPLRVRVLAPGRQTVTLHARTTGEAWRTIVLHNPNGARVVEASLGPMAGDLTLVADDGRALSDTAVVRVTDRPFVGAVAMQAIYPRYLGRPPEGLAVGEPARVPVGTVIDVRGRASTSLTRVRLAASGDTLSLPAQAHAFAGRIEARRSGRYVWLAEGASGPIADVPPPLELVVVPDSAPRVQILSPAVDSVVVPEGELPMRAAASDDHGVIGVELVSWRVTAAGAQQTPVSQRLALEPTTEWTGAAALSLALRGLQPGDALHAKFVATDNSPWGQRGESRELVLRVPSVEERRTLARDVGDSAVKAAKALAEAQKALAQKTEDASRERSDRGASAGQSNPSKTNGATSNEQAKQAMSFQASEKARGIAKEQRALADKTEQLRRTAQQLEQQLRQAGALDSSLARQLRDVQNLLKQALTPEMAEQMRKLEDASQQLSGDESRQAMRDLAEQQRKLREQIDKSAEMLRRAAIEGSMQTLSDEAKDIAKQERKLADSSGARGERKGDDARQLADRSKRLSDDVRELQQRLEREKAQAGSPQTEEARQRADASERSMRKAAGEMQPKPAPGEQKSGEQKADAAQRQEGQQPGGAPKSGASQRPQSGQRQPGGEEQGEPQEGGRQGGSQQAREAADQMDKAAQAMQDARDAQVKEWKQELTQELDQSIQELLQMAREESALEKQARSGQANAEQLRSAQSSISQGADQTSKRLDQAGKKSSLLSGRSERAMSDAKQKVQQAQQQLAQEKSGSSGQGSASSLGEAADALNKAAASLARDREKANAAKSASGFSEMMQQLQELAQKQGGINGQAQGLMQMPGGPQSPGAQATARALARQQRGVAEQLDELSDEAAGARAGELAKEAKAVAEHLEGGRIDQATLARQQQLFRRLLDAGRSLEKEEREDDSKREAKSATGDDRFNPEGTNATGKGATRFREPTWNELRGLSPEERRAILDYFKRINAAGGAAKP